MKYSIVFKLLALVLCAASLLGVVGGAAGTLVLVEGDLYNRTVDQLLDDKLRLENSVFADQTALAYASRELGGCPEDLTRQRYIMKPDCNYGYAIVDADGKVLESLNPEMKDSAEVYTIPVTGQYMHLVSTETESEAKAREAEARAALLGPGMEIMDGTVIPAEGISINQVRFEDALGNVIYEAYGDRNQCNSHYYYPDDYTTASSNYDHEPQGRIGFLFQNPEGQLMYRSFLEENEYEFAATEVCGVMFMSHDSDFYFTTSNPEGLGMLLAENGSVQFVTYPPEESAPEETIPETVPETTSETVPETVPETTSETVPETVPETTSETVSETAAAETEYVEETEYPEETEYYEEETEYYDEDASSASAEPEEEGDSGEWEDSSAAEAPAETLPPETLPEETPAAETIPAETIPGETVTGETVTGETVAGETVPAETLPEETEPEVTEPVLINGKPLEFYQVNRTEFHNQTTGELTTAKYVYLPMPEMTVEVYVDRSTMDNAHVYNVLRLVRQYRGYLLPAIGICLLTFALSVVYLSAAAGRTPKSEEVRAGALNRIPLDLYLGLGIFAGTGIAALAIYGTPVLLNSDFLLGCCAAAGAVFAVCLLVSGFLFAFIAQAKTPEGFWWRNTLSARFVFLCMRLLQWLEVWLRETGFPRTGRLFKKLWDLTVRFMFWAYHLWEKFSHWIICKLSAGFHWLGNTLRRFFSLIPLTWQWLLCGMILFLLIFVAANIRSGFLILLCLMGALAMIIYGAHCFGVLLDSTRKMAKGDLDSKVEKKLMLGSFAEFAEDLNGLADVAMVAAQKQLKSERMKTELITNVSHDIKTPLTSIINYVDLLRSAHTDEEEQQYLEVLDRQSQRLKKLVEDLMDMSKASTGNMTVEITRLDAVESVNQALGEFADKLERAQLHPVFRHSEDSIPIMADGKLVWRVLSNLLTNAVKYAMPGTRIYLDLTHVNGKVVFSLKNISREELNVTAEELMERFVRGDVSRNTEGSGLGLNIAKSLMELQKGHLQLLVDGDLFKVTLIFPDAE